MGFRVSPAFLLLLEARATNQPAHHPWGHLPQGIPAVQEADVLDLALCIMLHEALDNN